MTTKIFYVELTQKDGLDNIKAFQKVSILFLNGNINKVFSRFPER